MTAVPLSTFHHHCTVEEEISIVGIVLRLHQYLSDSLDSVHLSACRCSPLLSLSKVGGGSRHAVALELYMRDGVYMSDRLEQAAMQAVALAGLPGHVAAVGQ